MTWNTTHVHRPLAVYFEAKQHMFRNDPEFRFLEVGPLKCFHKHPGWPEVDAFYSVDSEPSETVAAIARYGPHLEHRITVFTESPEAIYEAYAALG